MKKLPYTIDGAGYKHIDTASRYLIDGYRLRYPPSDAGTQPDADRREAALRPASIWIIGGGLLGAVDGGLAGIGHVGADVAEDREQKGGIDQPGQQTGASQPPPAG